MTGGKESSHGKYHCDFPSCAQTFGRRTDCLRHRDEKHGPLKRCPEPSCTYAVRRDGRLTAHTARVHGYRYGDGGVPLVVPDDFPTANQAPTTAQSTTNPTALYQSHYQTTPQSTSSNPSIATQQYNTTQATSYAWSPPNTAQTQQQTQQQQPYYINDLNIQIMSNGTGTEGLEDWNWEGYL